MIGKYKLAVLCVSLGLTAPLTPRAVHTFLKPDGAELMWKWSQRLRHQLTHRPGRFCLEWGWILGPHIVLGLIALASMKRGLEPFTRRRRTAGFIAAAAVPAFIGAFLCEPTKGMGFSLYHGDFIFPMLAVPCMALCYPLGWWGARFVSARQQIGSSGPYQVR